MYLEGIEIVLTCGTDCGNKISFEWPADEYAHLGKGYIDLEEDNADGLDFIDASSLALDGGVSFLPRGWKGTKGKIYCPECVNSVT